jgi:hypothetical protein
MQLNISKKKYNIGEVFENIFTLDDVINTYIYKYLKFSDMIIFGLLNNKFKKDNEIIINSVKKIQKNFRIHRIPENYGSMELFDHLLSWQNYYKYMKIFKKNLLYRKILVHNNYRNWKNYPYFLVDKSMNSASSRYLIISDWLKRYFPDDINDVTKRDILNFFKENRITVREIIYTGW